MIKNSRGYTLIELIVVILIVGILAAIAIPAYVNITDNAHQANIDGVYGAVGAHVIMTAAESLDDTGTWAYPTNAEVNEAAVFQEDLDDWEDGTDGILVYTGKALGGPHSVEYNYVSDDMYTLVRRFNNAVY
ncbi:MAG: prepilin-type N-terminal cleavage/methylation domain-containing protein [Candidatus Neomarinimicrobiota bacterium]